MSVRPKAPGERTSVMDVLKIIGGLLLMFALIAAGVYVVYGLNMQIADALNVEMEPS